MHIFRWRWLSLLQRRGGVECPFVVCPWFEAWFKNWAMCNLKIMPYGPRCSHRGPCMVLRWLRAHTLNHASNKAVNMYFTYQNKWFQLHFPYQQFCKIIKPGRIVLPIKLNCAVIVMSQWITLPCCATLMKEARISIAQQSKTSVHGTAQHCNSLRRNNGRLRGME